MMEEKAIISLRSIWMMRKGEKIDGTERATMHEGLRKSVIVGFMA